MATQLGTEINFCELVMAVLGLGDRCIAEVNRAPSFPLYPHMVKAGIGLHPNFRQGIVEIAVGILVGATLGDRPVVFHHIGLRSCFRND